MSFFQSKAYRQLKRNKLAIAGTIFIILLFIIALFAPVIAPFSPYKTDFMITLQGPSSDHLLGTDDLGRDVLSRLIYGARISLVIGFISVAIGLAVGVPIGAISGYYGGKIDIFVQRLVDIMMAFPGMLLAI